MTKAIPYRPCSKRYAASYASGQGAASVKSRCNPASYLESVDPRARAKDVSPRGAPGGPPATGGSPSPSGLEGRTVPFLRSVSGDTYPDWEAIYLDNVERIYRIIYGRVGNRPEAEDLTAEVFRAALGPLRLSASKGEVRAYLRATARTVLASHWRRHYSVEITALDPERDQATTEEVPTETLAPQRVARVLAALPERYGRILQLRFLEACSVRDAARAMNISVANAKVLQHRALRQAAQLFEEAM